MNDVPHPHLSGKSPAAERSQYLDLRSSWKWFLLSGTVGVFSGLGAVVFQYLIGVVALLTSHGIAGFAPGEALGEHAIFEHGAAAFSPMLLILVLAAGGLVSGTIVQLFAPEAAGHGTDAAIDAFHRKRGVIRAVIPIVKTIASAITLGTSGSGGREGPIAQIGAGIGSWLATRLNLPARDRRILLAAGMAAGVGAVFRAPLAGALFSAEILYRQADLESEVIVPSAISSIVAYSVYCLTLPADLRFVPLFGSNLHYTMGSPLELVPYTLLAVVLCVVGIAYIKLFYAIHDLFSKWKLSRFLKPAVGAAAAGGLAVTVHALTGGENDTWAILGTGYGTLQRAVSNAAGMSAIVLLVVAFCKILATGLTIGSGGSGGVFGPSMVIGGSTGASLGLLFHNIFPAIMLPNPGACAIVGMAGFFAGCAHAPISTIIMVSEMTGDYRLLVPTMWVSTICFLLMQRYTLYRSQSISPLESPAHRGDFIVDVLEGITVGEVYQSHRKIVLIPEGTSLESIVHTVAETHQHYFPVVDTSERIIGIFSSDDVRSYLYNESIWKLAVARDVMNAPVVSVKPTDDLNLALRRFTARNLDELPVIDESGKLLGMLRRKEVISNYNRRLIELKRYYTDADASRITQPGG